MPVGPSHGARGGRSRSGGGFSSSTGSSSRYRTGRSTRVFYYGGTGGSYNATPMSPKSIKITATVFGLIFSIIFLIVSISLLFTNAGPAALIRKDAGEYAEIIKRASANEDGYYLITIDNITCTGGSHDGYDITYRFRGNYNSSFDAYSYLKRNGVQYFYLEFTFTDSSGNNVTGETYAMYSESAIDGFSEITFAYTKLYDNDGSWDVINANYNLASNTEYLKYRDAAIAGGIMLAISALLVVFLIYAWYRVAHDLPIFKKADKDETASKNEEKVQKRVCSYCGSDAKEDTQKCSACGSRSFKYIFVKKKK